MGGGPPDIFHAQPGEESLVNEFFWVTVPYTNIPVVAVLFFVGLWFLLRTRATPLDSSAELDGRIGVGSPVVLEFFSNT